MEPTSIALITVGFVFVLVLLGAHIGVALALLSVIGIWGITGKLNVAISLLNTTAYSAVMDYVFAVIPLFVLMGILATLSGATRDLFSAAQVLFGRIRGGIGIATVIANAIFAAITGVSVASAAVFSKLAIPEMERLNYDRNFSYGIVAGSAILGMLIPPSILMIVYGVLTEQSIGRLFAAGVGPGLLVTAILSLGIWLMVFFSPRLGGQLEKLPPMDWNTAVRTAVKPWGVILLVCLVLGGLYGGFFTPTEAGGIGAAGAMVLVIINRKFSWKAFVEVLTEIGRTTASIFLLLIAAQMYSRMLTISGLATKMSEWAAGLPVPPMVIILMFLVVFLLLGCIIDSVSILLLTIPIMFPVIIKLGYDPIWFGMVSIIAIEIGLLTPPFGMVVFAMKSSLGSSAKIEDIFLGAWPFILMLVLALGFVIAYPAISTWLPSVIM
ncbi:MAG TPA: TRAP transporter large permease [Polaromonas sp.]|nr:TRAP transporter large permease [Polaromonas sp.]